MTMLHPAHLTAERHLHLKAMSSDNHRAVACSSVQTENNPAARSKVEQKLAAS